MHELDMISQYPLKHFHSDIHIKTLITVSIQIDDHHNKQQPENKMVR